MGTRTPLGTLIVLGKIARMMFAFLAFCTVDGSRERGAKIELALRIRVDRELDEGGEGDVDREERRER
jgi:hypothetical protein